MAEEEIELDIDSETIPRAARPEGQENAVRVDQEEKVNQEIVDLGKEMTDDEFIRALADAPDEMIIPWEDVPIPSDGIYYEGWTNGTVRCRAMTQSVEKGFANRRLVQSGGAIDKMFQACCELPGGWDPQNLLIGDRTFLLYYIRGLTFGNLYKFIATCPACQAESQHTYDMNELYSTVIPVSKDLGDEPFKVVLPHLTATSGREIWVGLRFLRQSDISDIMSKRRFNKKLSGNSVRSGNTRRRGRAPQRQANTDQQKTQAEMVLDSSLEKTIVCVNNDKDPMLISKFVQRMHSRDNAAIRDFLMQYTPGIDTTVTVECQECQNEATMELPITDGFFRTAD